MSAGAAMAAKAHNCCRLVAMHQVQQLLAADGAELATRLLLKGRDAAPLPPDVPWTGQGERNVQVNILTDDRHALGGGVVSVTDLDASCFGNGRQAPLLCTSLPFGTCFPCQYECLSCLGCQPGHTEHCHCFTTGCLCFRCWYCTVVVAASVAAFRMCTCAILLLCRLSWLLSISLGNKQ